MYQCGWSEDMGFNTKLGLRDREKEEHACVPSAES